MSVCFHAQEYLNVLTTAIFITVKVEGEHLLSILIISTENCTAPLQSLSIVLLSLGCGGILMSPNTSCHLSSANPHSVAEALTRGRNP